MATDTKFTDGPWVWWDCDGMYYELRGPMLDDGLVLDSLTNDAHLIAAAPDLYAALEAIIAWEQSEDGPFAWEVLGQAKAAIAKARGEAV